MTSTPEERTGRVRVGEAEVAFRFDGPPGAPVLVLSSSLGTTAEMWDPQVGALAGRFRLLRYDHRGHGGSSAPPGPYTMPDLGGDLVGLLDALGVERAALCGVSLGGMVAAFVAARHPERVEALVLACTAAALPPASSWHERAAAVREGGSAKLADALFGRWFTEPFRAGHPEVLEEVARMLASCSSEGYAGCCEAIAATDLHDDLAAIRAPTLVIGGLLDPVCPPATILDLASGIAGAAIAVLPGAAHLASVEQPERFNAAVLDHLLGPAALRGMAVRRAVLGDAHVDAASASATPFSQPFLDLVTRLAWGEVWTRPALDRRTRSAVTLAMLVALGRFDELAFHVPAALRSGLGRDEISEILLHSAVYCGVPAARSAFAVASRALAAPGTPGSDGPEGRPEGPAGPAPASGSP